MTTTRRVGTVRGALVFLAVLGTTTSAWLFVAAEDYTFLPVAGRDRAHNLFVPLSRDGVGDLALFGGTAGMAAASDGTLYAADREAHTIRKISPAFAVSTLAGLAGTAGSADGSSSTARFSSPSGVAVDSAGNVYVADTNNHAIRRIAPNGDTETFAGLSGTPGAVNGTGADARFRQPTGIVIDSADTLFVADAGNHAIRRITQDRVVTTFAGQLSQAGSGSEDGVGTDARFYFPVSLAIDAAGTLFVADRENHTIRRISSTGEVTTIAGRRADMGQAVFIDNVAQYGTTDGPAASARFAFPQRISVASDGRLFVISETASLIPACTSVCYGGPADRLRVIETDGSVSTLRARGWTLDGVLARPGGAVLVSELDTNAILSVNQAGSVTGYAGHNTGCTSLYPIDGARANAKFCAPGGITVTPAGVIYVSDSRNLTIRRILPSGTTSTIAGLRGTGGTADGAGSTARFNATWGPLGIGVDAAGVIYVADTGNHTIRRITEAGVVSTLGGLAGIPGSGDGAGGDARFRLPRALAVAANGTVYVADTENSTIRRILPNGSVSTIAGVAGLTGAADGTGSGALFNKPTGIAVAPDGTLYVADQLNATIRRVGTSGVVTTIAGLAGTHASVDGTGATARFLGPLNIAINPAGTVLFVGDEGNGRLRRVTVSGEVTTIAGIDLGTVLHGEFPGALALGPGDAVYVSGNLIRVGVTGDAAAPAITTSPTNATVQAGGTATFVAVVSGNPVPALQWQVSINDGETWANIVNSATVSGATASTLSISAVALSANGNQYRLVAENALGAVTSAAVTLSATGASATPAALQFAMLRNQPEVVTGAQRVVFAYVGAGTPVWSVSSNQPWLTASGSNGASTGGFSVSVSATGFNPQTAPETLSATLTATASNVGVTVQLPVTLRLEQSNSSTLVGQVDTPLQGETVAGAIGITGWVLDTVGIRHIKVYRNCIEGLESCASGQVPGIPSVYIGDAVIVAGARPDLEAIFPTYPAAQSAGWGMQILSNMLPRNTVSFAPQGGQGPLTLYVIAESVTGTSKLLGREWSNPVAASTQVTMDNDAIAKPFGTIDTPLSGEVIGGTFSNFGWALTPDLNTTADGTDIVIPTNGSSMVVFIDGVATATVAYNQCRGTVGNPVPGGAFCNDDVANAFGNVSPQPVFTERTGNPTRFRNLDAGRAAIGAYVIDTTTLSNGMHTIAWSVTDSAGRVEGVGSRFFGVLNGAMSVAAVLGDVASVLRPSALRTSPFAGRSLSSSGDQVWGRVGFDLSAPWVEVPADSTGTRHGRIPPLEGRLELWLGDDVEGGFLQAGDTRRQLPLGSHLDPQTGRFTWVPGPGYLGTYRLGFVRAGSVISFDVTIAPKQPTPPGVSEVRMHLDEISTVAPGSLRVSGWALDPQAGIGSGIGPVHVWARRVGVSGAAPVFLGEATTGMARPDAAGPYGPRFSHSGFVLDAAPGTGIYEVTAYVWNLRTRRWEDARSARIVVR